VNAHTKLKWRCSEGHEWENTPGHIKSGQWCPYCAGRYQTIEEMLEIAKERGGECLSKEYVNSASNLRWRCSIGHEWEATPDNVKRGTWCPYCAIKIRADKQRDTIENMRKIVQSRCGECLSKKYVNDSTKLRWRCSEGHEWEASPNYIKKGVWCPICSQGVSERICCATFEKIFKEKFPKKRPKWLINPETGKLLELDGYCKKLRIAFEFHGEQHYREIEFFHTTRSFKEQQRIDQLKRKLCGDHGVKLIEVPMMDYEEIAGFIMKECRDLGIDTGPVPLDAFDYRGFDVYSPHKLEEMKQIAEFQGGKCLSKNYVNAHTKLRWRCSEGHEWENTPGHIKGGQWCPYCATKKSAEKQRDTIENMRKIAKERGGKCLSDKYVNAHTKLKWRCSEGHEWETVPQVIKKGGWCPYCATEKSAEKQRDTIENMRKIAKERGGKCLSKKYVNNSTKLRWRCSEGHEWEAIPGNIKSRNWCPYCAGKAPSTIEKMREIAMERGGECLSDKYVNAHTKLKWRCSEGHEWKNTPGHIKSGQWCPYCAGRYQTIEDMREIAESRGGECLSKEYVNSKTKLKWRCSEGHEWEAVPSSVKSGTWCPVCARRGRRKKK
ncbi:MAG: hypothetical protein KAU14_05020, partial [Thermoplasmata archaeon]|nr:hypothetical protein [Thermoplasmata archaeon]